jgi:hypothetical protein
MRGLHSLSAFAPDTGIEGILTKSRREPLPPLKHYEPPRKTTARWALTLDGRQQHYERQQPDYHLQGPFGRFADHLSAARRLSPSALAS